MFVEVDKFYSEGASMKSMSKKILVSLK